MRKLLALFLLATLSAAPTVAQDAPPARVAAPGALAGYVHAGYIANVRERDHGVWLETGLARRRFQLGIGFSDMLTDSYKFRELEAVGRFWLVPSFAIEAGHGWGFACWQPEPALCDRFAWRTFAPFAGFAYRQNIRRHLAGILRFDVTPTQLRGRPWPRAKDDGLRLRIGIEVRP